MPTLLRPLSGYAPTSTFGHRVAAPPNSTLSDAQRKAAQNDPLSFRRAVGRGASASHTYALAWIDDCLDQGVLRPVGPAIFIYRQGIGPSAITGILADVSLNAYKAQLVKRHEKTIAKTERKMAKYMKRSRVYGNPVALAHRPHQAIRDAISTRVDGDAAIGFATVDGVFHQLWLIEGNDAAELCRSFNDTLYITDGHHRLAAAARLASKRGNSSGYLPAALFSTEDVTARSFVRCIADADLDTDSLVARLASEHLLEEVAAHEVRPRERGEFGMKVNDKYFRLRLRHSPAATAVDALDVRQLQDRVLGPVFGITDATSDKRLSFVADLTNNKPPQIEGDVWILPFPVDINDVTAAADEGGVMPPKSTWLAPKVPNGILIRKPRPE